MVSSTKLETLLASEAIVKCPARVKATSGKLADLIENHLVLIDSYETCKAYHGSLVDLIKTL